MRLHLLRHGETRHNAEGRIQGDALDDGLNDVGRAQAAALARHYARAQAEGSRVVRVYASPLQRALQTATAIADALGLSEPTVLHGLREISWGHHMGRLNAGPTRTDMVRILDAWDQGDLSAKALGGETPGEAWQRAMLDLSPVIERHADEEVLIVAHGRINKVLTSGLLHGHLHHMDRYPQANASISILAGPAPWRLLASNVTTHLAGLRTMDERAS